MQEALSTLEKAAENITTRRAALLEAEERCAAAGAAEAGSDAESATDEGPSLEILRDDVTAAVDQEQQASAAVDAAAAALQEAQTVAGSLWEKTQVYWTKGLADTVPGLVAACNAGIPIRAVLKVSDPEKEEAPDEARPEPALFANLVAAHAGASWNDPALAIAAVSIHIGPAGGRFAATDAGKQGAEAAAGVDPPAGLLRGAGELQTVFREIERCSAAYSRWELKHKLYDMRESATASGTLKTLLESIEPEQQSVPVLLHCMLEQVACNVEGAASEVEESNALIKAGMLFDDAFQAVRQSGVVSVKDSQQAFNYCTVLDCDEAGKAAAGLFSGYVQPPKKPGTPFSANSDVDSCIVAP